jgi:hypothetical protein
MKTSFHTPAELKDWLIERELHYGGMHKEVARKKVSPLDPRSTEVIAQGGMTGGDRMQVHGYAGHYARFLMPFVQRRKSKPVLVEAGILRGTGLAIWADLFPGSRIIGLDIDLSHTRENLPFLTSRRAFSQSEPELYEFDQFVDERAKMRDILGADRIAIYIDDGFHSDDSILQSFASIQPFLARRFAAFIEDNADVWWRLQERYPQYDVRHYGMLTVMTPAPWWRQVKRSAGKVYRRFRRGKID